MTLYRWEPTARITPEEALQHEWLVSGGGGGANCSSSPNTASNSSHNRSNESSTSGSGGGGGSYHGESVGTVDRRREVAMVGGGLVNGPQAGVQGTVSNQRKPLSLNHDSTEEDVYTLYKVGVMDIYICFISFPILS